jgi:hypothetical protein
MLVIDRFEGDIAVIEYDKGNFFDLPRFLIPDTASEGDVISIEIKIDKTSSNESNRRIKILLDELFEDNEED